MSLRQESQEQRQSMDKSSTLTCGICLSDGGKLIRGFIDSCDHYFCFVCIMEWARVESRCPMCKCRFTTIRRPPKHGVFTRERVVNVPQRDQVYHLLGNATTGPSDPFADTKCCICHSMADENLMLLCDLCDSAGHTYCVGLGCTVPEGDWFCHDCAVSRAEHEQSEIDADTDQHISVNCVVIPTAESPVSIFSIIQGSNDSTFERPLPRVGSSMNHFSLPVILEEESSVEHGENREGRRAHQNTAGEAAESCARTFFLRRNVHSRILVLRENWEALRNGSLRFSSNPAEPCGISGKKGDTAAVPHDRSGQPNCPSSVRKQTSQDGTPGCTGHKRKSHDVDKAWKMMDIARSIRLNCGSSSSVHRTSKTLANKGDFSKQSSTTNSSLCLSKDPGLRTGNLGGNGMKKQWISYSKNTETQSHRSCKLENQKQSWFMNGESNGGFPLGKYSSGNYKSTSSRKVQTGNDVTATNSFVKNSHQVSKESGHCSLKTLAEPRPGGFDTLESKVELRVASSSLVDYSEEKVVRRKDGTETKKRQVGDAQNEIQSLVKLNLKLLSGEKRLGVETFKEVAWLATHTILAACGLEHPKPRIRNSRSPSPICSHTDQIHQLHRSTLMPNSCRGCFYVFVKDVVSSFMIGKVGNLR
ncbi:uncharacterized protein LOC110823171 isoform X2 [Carica papaya]|uniref:uncharacterized protein LOC110823171 isoform X2 n=1 Tax=Carica papaya TaxID=3649 RepID=UPI000B8C7043|nr:uncharacterized protein LOC110823171 isoform X2 [Carica papaya]XP_021909188.1 uncharacterized protein LOC110823171 isoform X2 [Carica papaya]